MIDMHVLIMHEIACIMIMGGAVERWSIAPKTAIAKSSITAQAHSTTTSHMSSKSACTYGSPGGESRATLRRARAKRAKDATLVALYAGSGALVE